KTSAIVWERCHRETKRMDQPRKARVLLSIETCGAEIERPGVVRQAARKHASSRLVSFIDHSEIQCWRPLKQTLRQVGAAHTRTDDQDPVAASGTAHPRCARVDRSRP